MQTRDVAEHQPKSLPSAAGAQEASVERPRWSHKGTYLSLGLPLLGRLPTFLPDCSKMLLQLSYLLPQLQNLQVHLVHPM
jgi:hypothetical protein